LFSDEERHRLMEIEAKFTIPDLRTYRDLANVSEIGGYMFSPALVKHYQDTYLDTETRALSARLYVCRRRTSADGSLLITVKGPGSAAGAVHRREEYEIELPANSSPNQWPDCEARAQVLAIIGDGTLTPFLGLQQTRKVRSVSRDHVVVAEWSLDEVSLETEDGRVQHYFELEIELKESGNERDLDTLSTEIVSRWPLTPQPRSKFERALAFVEQGAAS
jgi:inorganic triphosphatase YgiF